MNILLLAELPEDYLIQQGKHSVRKTTWTYFLEEKIRKDITLAAALKDYRLIIILFQEAIEGLIRYIKKECPNISFLILLPARCDMIFSVELKGNDGNLLIAPDFISNLENWQEKIEEVLNSILQRGGKECFG